MEKKYDWDESDLENDLMELKRKLKTVNDKKIKDDIKLDIKYLKDDINLLNEDYDNDQESYFNIPFSYYYNKKYRKLFETEIADTKPFYENKYIQDIVNNATLPLDYHNKDFSNEETFLLVHDFYKMMDKDLFNVFLKHYNERYRAHTFKTMNCNVGGISYYIASLNKCYTISCSDKNINKLMALTHESAHAISYMLGNGLVAYDNNLVDEVDSTFMELVASDYFNNYFHDKDFDKYKLNMLKDMADYADTMFNVLELIKSLGHFIKDYKDKIEYVDYLKVNYNFLCELNYLYSFICSIELYHEYLNDKDKALFHYKEIITKPYDNAKIKEIITPNAHLNEFCEKTLKKVQL